MAKILLVEDDNNLREIYSARLQAEGYTIVAAKDGEEALVVAKGEKPDLVISDVMMPKISGFEMLDILRNTDGLKEVKVIMLTALGQSDDQQRADKLGADRYLVKSQFTLEDIVKTAHDLLEGDAVPASDPAAATPAADTAAPSEPAPVAAAPADPVAPASATAAPEPVVTAPPPAPDPASAAPVTDAPVEPPAEPPKVDAGETPASTSASPATPATPSTTPGLVIEETPPATPSEPAAQSSQPAPTPETGSVAASTAQEEADVESKIEDFVAGASSEPTAPASTVAPATAEPASPEAEVVVAPPEGSPTSSPDVKAADDNLLSDAVNNLAGVTEPAKTEIASPAAGLAAVEPTPADQEGPSGAPTTVAPTAPAPVADVEVAPSSPETPDNDHVKIANKKVISPIDSQPKKDIDTLLKLEEAKAAAAAPPPAPTAVIATDKDGAQQTPLAAPEAPPDPHDIAL
jgi:CheY-like chemotaxis protein